MEPKRYPSTPHMLFSPGVHRDDKSLKDYSAFEGKEVVVTIKMDGENTNLYRDKFHARSPDGRTHPSRNWVKGLHGRIQHNIPEDWKICGENLYALHSIAYEDLKSYFYCFNIWNEKDECLSYDDTLEWCTLLGLEHVPVVYRGQFDAALIEKIFTDLDKTKDEGIVVRCTNAFTFKEFSNNYCKAVRENHVQTDEHWMTAKIIPNKLT